MAKQDEQSAAGGRGRPTQAGGQGQGRGASDLEYDLISLIYHNLQGVEASGRYMSDAVEAGDDACAEVFRQAQQAYLEQADRARQRLHEHLGGSQGQRR
jgi:hypothetical protein